MGNNMTSENIIRKEELQKLTDSVIRMQKDFDTVQTALKKLIDKEIQELESEDQYWNKQAEMQNE
jgi:CII-binding regulator of phage lambda lysogenization HflD